MRNALDRPRYCGAARVPSFTVEMRKEREAKAESWINHTIGNCFVDNSPAKRILIRSSGCSIRVDVTPPEMPATMCSYLTCEKMLNLRLATGINGAMAPPLTEPLLLPLLLLAEPEFFMLDMVNVCVADCSRNLSPLRQEFCGAYGNYLSLLLCASYKLDS